LQWVRSTPRFRVARTAPLAVLRPGLSAVCVCSGADFPTSFCWNLSECSWIALKKYKLTSVIRTVLNMVTVA
jgi:hypothetical protein